MGLSYKGTDSPAEDIGKARFEGIEMHQQFRASRIGAIILAMLFPFGTLIRSANRNPEERKPPRVYVDAGACPFECCTYREWTVEEKTALLDRPGGARVITTVSKGDTVMGLTGEVISTPIPVVADRDVPETPIKKGDTFYVLHYEGEGYWKVWLRGKTTQIHQSVMDVPQPRAKWWVKIRDSHGNVGWALSHRNFGHQDTCE
jgi:hypothetical protein